ncbi:MAG: ATP-binding cassette domain-containing protein [bacterium]
MIVSINIEEKTIGSKLLLKDLNLNLQANQKIAIIGRNGVGKTTLLGLINGEDEEFVGNITRKKGLVIATSRQEHAEVEDISVVDYILSELPEYLACKSIMEAFAEISSPSDTQLSEYSEALERFMQLDYYRAEDRVLQELDKYQIDDSKARSLIKQLSGGQKRFVELVKIAESKVDLALIDEPTNHMDYIAKAEFITWLASAKGAVVLVSHDRDVLANVDTIIEVKDHKALIFTGNYDAYLKQNSLATVAGMNNYEVQLSTMDNLKKQLVEANRKKAGSSKTPNPFIPMVRRFQKQIEELEKVMVKPSFWIDQQSVEGMSKKITDRYDKYKTKNIAIATDQAETGFQNLLTISDLSIGYQEPLFSGIAFNLNSGDRAEIRGRNGAGKSSFIKLILKVASGSNADIKVFSGAIIPENGLRIGYYEQEISTELLNMTLAEAIESVYVQNELAVNQEKIMQIAAQYLFDPRADLNLKLKQLSGGQKARFQIIKMLAPEPNLLILDEPTNHLDLPSIEELESALLAYTGAILYVSHDNYFRDKLGGAIINI